MDLYELELQNLIEVKIMRINQKKLNELKINTIASVEKFGDFVLEENNTQNLEYIQNFTSGFGRILFCETLEAIVLINNLSDKEIRIKDIKFKVSNEILEEYESMFKKFEFYLINSNNPHIIPSGYFMHKRIKILADTMCKYVMEISIEYGSIYYNDEFLKHSTNKVIKTISNHYYITSNPSNVIVKFFKKFLFSTNLPFKVKDKIVTNNMEKSFIEINLTNPSPYTLKIKEINLLMDSPLINSNAIDGKASISPKSQMQEFVRNENRFFTCTNTINDIIGQPSSCYLEPEEEVNFSFTVTNYKAFINSNSFVFRVAWCKKDENDVKYINYSLKNKAINDLFSLLIIDKPSDVVKKDEYFNLILQIVNKTQRFLKLKIFYEKISDREFDIIDIVEKEFELKDKMNVTLICKSDVQGNVYLPKLSIMEESLKKTIHFEKLFSFNSVVDNNLI